MAEDHRPAAASTAAPPTGKDGICVAHAAVTSGGSSGGDVSSTEDVYDGEEECEPCPKASRGSNKISSNNNKTTTTNNNNNLGGGIDGALRAERGSPYARPRKEAKSPAVGEDAIVQNRRVYVGNLSWQVTWRELKDHMKSGGTLDVVRADVLTGYDGRSRGCGIVEYGTAEDANAAISSLNDTELMGRKIFVREDREEGRPTMVASSSSSSSYVVAPASSGGGGVGGGGIDEAAAAGRRVYVGNLAYEVAWQDLKDHMRSAGDVVRAEVLTMHDGRSKGCGVVEYASADAASRAIAELHDSELMGRQIFVREDREARGGNNNIGGGGGGGGGGGAREGDGGYLAGWHRGGGGGGGGGPRGNAGNLSVYVGNLAYETTWQELKDHMRAAGNVDKADILKSADGRSKGCGIVLYQKSHEVARAIRELQNSELHGRPILVREDREQGGGFGNNRGGRQGGVYQQQHHHRGAGVVPVGPAPEGCQLFVGNLSWETGWQELKDHFRQCGHVDRAEVAEGPDGVKRGFGLVRYRNAMDAANAIDTLNGVEFMGRPLEVRIDNKA
ncbi:hypothetical protein ACHAW5_001599 [Stephanodiscus triporus]|uniref:RRM domain-containing protein n=1 Tax=Stephanodiscus triporus TaxID=2934178 RepID=A0ABD3PAK2_9STRA